MIQDISIENFRCFEKFQMEGFARINLIAGLNNTGKTCLLEALYLLLNPDEFNKDLNLRLSKEKSPDTETAFFTNRDYSKKIKLKSKSPSIHYDVISSLKRSQLFLSVERNTLNKIFPFVENESLKTGFILDKKTQFPRINNLAEVLDSVELSGYKHLIIKAIQNIDKTIIDLRTFASKPNILYIQRGDKYLPIEYFGDAIQKIIAYAATILSWADAPADARKYLFLDEIENGLHHTVQAEFWGYLFRLAKAFGVQIFATTHSLEMIKAFAKTAEATPEMAAYFELGRHVKTNQILSFKQDLSLLSYNLEHNQNIRGEA
jgi:AAA15 family ATPase/GTPase